MSEPLFPLEDIPEGEHPDNRKIKKGAHPWAPSQLDAWEADDDDKDGD